MTAPTLGECLTQGWPQGCWATLLDSGQLGLGAVVATFFGAWAALRLQERADRAHEKERELEGLLFAQVTLALQLNTLENLRVQQLEPFRENPQRAFQLLQIGNSAPKMGVDLRSLAFAPKAEDPGLIQAVHLANLRYFSALDALADRNREHERFQEKYAHVGAGTFVPDPHSEIRLKHLTDILYESVDVAVGEAPEVIEQLSATIRKRHPGAKVITVKPAADSAASST